MRQTPTVEVSFVVPESVKSIAQAAGITAAGGALHPCPFSVGDFVSFPEAPSLFFRVTGRVYQASLDRRSAQWLVLLEQSGDPLVPLDEHRP